MAKLIKRLLQYTLHKLIRKGKFSLAHTICEHLTRVLPQFISLYTLRIFIYAYQEEGQKIKDLVLSTKQSLLNSYIPLLLACYQSAIFNKHDQAQSQIHEVLNSNYATEDFFEAYLSQFDYGLHQLDSHEACLEKAKAFPSLSKLVTKSAAKYYAQKNQFQQGMSYLIKPIKTTKPHKRWVITTGDDVALDLQMLRLLPLVKQHTESVWIVSSHELALLLNQIPLIDKVLSQNDKITNEGIVMPLTALPVALNIDPTTLTEYAPIICPDPKEHAASVGDKDETHIGLLSRADNHFPSVNFNSVGLRSYTKIIEQRRCHHLQQGRGRKNTKRVTLWKALHDHDSELNDLADLAGLMQHMDLIVSVDTIALHIAALMGKPTIFIQGFAYQGYLPTDPEAIHAWYPSVKTMRQEVFKYWKPVLDELDQTISEMTEQPIRQAQDLPDVIVKRAHN